MQVMCISRKYAYLGINGGRRQLLQVLRKRSHLSGGGRGGKKITAGIFLCGPLCKSCMPVHGFMFLKIHPLVTILRSKLSECPVGKWHKVITNHYFHQFDIK